MSGKLYVIALISGGKDSLYSILHCVQNGHEIVALANLYPQRKHRQATVDLSSNGTEDTYSKVGDQDDEGEDLDSFMYQTVGHSVIPLYEEALGLPLYRREILGSNVTTDKYYSFATADKSVLDETEDLIPLLSAIIAAHPTANAIATGAIQSTYQRTRVESVALRLGLIPIGYLWQYPILPPPPTRLDSLTGLLEDMEAAGCDARIIKIASGGIQERQLWTNVAESKTRQALVRGLSVFFENDELGLRGAVVGEGGEFETLALKGPRAVWRGGIIAVDVDDSENWVGEGGTSYVRLKNARVIKHEIETEQLSSEGALVRLPGLLDARFEALTKSLCTNTRTTNNYSPRVTSTAHTTSSMCRSGVSVLISETTVQVNNLSYLDISSSTISTRKPSPTEQMEQIASQLPKLITQIPSDRTLSTSDIVHTILLLRSMNTFAEVNPIYATMFPQGVPNPPARVTVATELPADVDITLSVIIDRSARSRRRGLHVQSRSYWAPANIGPYSQAISAPLQGVVHGDESYLPEIEIVHMAGQIPLVPSSMELLADGFLNTAVLALQHLWRAGQERQIDLWTVGVALLPGTTDPTGRTSDVEDNLCKVQLAAEAWQEAHKLQADGRPVLSGPDDNEDDHGLDIWDMRNNRLQAFSHQTVAQASTSSDYLHKLPLIITNIEGIQIVITPPFIAAEVTSLPRMATVEWWSTGLTGIPPGPDPVLVDFRVTEEHFGTRSTLTVMQNHHGSRIKTKFVTYLIKRLGSSSESDDSNDNSSWPVSRSTADVLIENDAKSGRVTSGTTFLTAYGQQLLKSSDSSDSSDTSNGICAEATRKDSDCLLTSLAVIPCSHVWADAGQQVLLSSSTESTYQIEKATPFEAAISIRIDVTE